MRKQITAERFERNQFIQERRLKPMDLRCKTRMCNYGTCREEFYLTGDPGCGSKIYCDDHRGMALTIAQAKYRKTISKETIRDRNSAYRKKHPNYRAEDYQKNRAKNIAYAQRRRDEKKALNHLNAQKKLRSITHGVRGETL
jgi:hypothetical protein